MIRLSAAVFAAAAFSVPLLTAPIRVVAVIGLIGVSQVVKDPAVFQGLSPTWALRFMIDHGVQGYLVLGAFIVLIVVAFPKGIVGVIETLRLRYGRTSRPAEAARA